MTFWKSWKILCKIEKIVKDFIQKVNFLEVVLATENFACGVLAL